MNMVIGGLIYRGLIPGGVGLYLEVYGILLSNFTVYCRSRFIV